MRRLKSSKGMGVARRPLQAPVMRKKASLEKSTLGFCVQEIACSWRTDARLCIRRSDLIFA